MAMEVNQIHSGCLCGMPQDFRDVDPRGLRLRRLTDA